MDIELKRQPGHQPQAEAHVSILVLMDIELKQYPSIGDAKLRLRFNPCFNGYRT